MSNERERARRSIDDLKRYLNELKPLMNRYGKLYSQATHYYKDAIHYFEKGDNFTSFGCSDYAYGLLDAIKAIEEERPFPTPVVGAVIVDANNKIFLMKSYKFRDMYTIPGGHIEVGETLEHAIVREVKEETNLNVANPKFIIAQQLVHDPIFWKKRHFIMLDFACKVKPPKRVRLSREGQSYIWIRPEDALKRNDIEPYTINTIKHFLNLGLMR
ncbi:MAG: DUF357 domain-containing protein [Candidatus Micrarchaeia archaeon]